MDKLTSAQIDCLLYYSGDKSKATSLISCAEVLELNREHYIYEGVGLTNKGEGVVKALKEQDV